MSGTEYILRYQGKQGVGALSVSFLLLTCGCLMSTTVVAHLLLNFLLIN